MCLCLCECMCVCVCVPYFSLTTANRFLALCNLLILAQCSMQNASVLEWKAKHTHIRTRVHKRAPTHTHCITCSQHPLLVKTNINTLGTDTYTHDTQNWSFSKEHHYFKIHTLMHTSTGPQTFPHSEANSLGIDSIPICFSVYNGKIHPLTQSTSNIDEGGSQGMPCFSANRGRGGNGSMPIIYVPGVSSLNPSAFFSATGMNASSSWQRGD